MNLVNPTINLLTSTMNLVCTLWFYRSIPNYLVHSLGHAACPIFRQTIDDIYAYQWMHMDMCVFSKDNILRYVKIWKLSETIWTYFWSHRNGGAKVCDNLWAVFSPDRIRLRLGQVVGVPAASSILEGYSYDGFVGRFFGDGSQQNGDVNGEVTINCWIFGFSNFKTSPYRISAGRWSLPAQRHLFIWWSQDYDDRLESRGFRCNMTRSCIPFSYLSWLGTSPC